MFKARLFGVHVISSGSSSVLLENVIPLLRFKETMMIARSNACEETMMKLRVVIINITEQVVLAE